MKKAILATKVGMTQIFDENGVLVPVTVLQAGPCVVTQVKTADNDGYSAIQVGFGEKKENRVNKPMKGQFAKAGVSCKRYLKEFRFEDAETYTLGQEIKADIFGAGDKIDATATSKGKGFQGAIKRHGQSRGPMAHGSKYHRHAGSNGACSDPSKVFKGKRMPLQPGMTLAIEPMITAGGYAVRWLDDDWTVVTEDGSLAAHYENTILITEGEPEILTLSHTEEDL